MLIGLFAIGAAAVGGYWALAFALQRSVVFPAPQASDQSTALPESIGRQVWLEGTGSRSEAWFLPAQHALGARPLIIYAHGNGELIDDWARQFEVPRSWGMSVLLVEYPGYGRSSGHPSEASITRAMVAAYDWATSQPSVDSSRIIGYGRSLGGGAVCSLSKERPLAALMLESTFTSIRSMAARFGLPGFVVRDPFDNLAVVRDFPGPILLLHGERDDVIPAAHARNLSAAAPHAELHLVPGGHNDCPPPWAVMSRFLAAHDLLMPGEVLAPARR